MATSFRCGAVIRVVCSNTLSAALRDRKYSDTVFSMWHLRKWDKNAAQEARETMGMATEQVAKVNEVAEALAKVAIDSDDWMKFMRRLLGDDNLLDKKGALTRTAQALLNATTQSPGANLASAKSTLWGALNAVTYFADHVRGNTADELLARDRRMAASWFGELKRMKQDAVDIAVEMAGITI